ncbi:hypothetical protein [Polluticoccus soli]|uniref:hypothetical protein n=1 Tax=Polluticoccus soli TaxID=3034150 RepID=UPI0023E270FE|nr:hypothetical protein [Flavipsychrobacter sp. JY13-12]
MTLANYELKENPFRIGPPLNAKQILWAGFPELKSKIEQRIVFGIKTSPSRIVLNWGRYGSGKTHAANFFTRTDAVLQLANEANASPVKSIKVNLPRTSKDPVQAFLRSFLGQVSLLEIKKDFDALTQRLTGPVVSDLLAGVSSDSVIMELFKIIINDEDGDKYSKIEAYLFGDSTKGTLTNLGLPAGLKDDEQIVNLLSTYFNCITHEKVLYSSINLWIDEFEDIDTLSKVSQDRFTTFLRQLFDKTPNNLTLFLNFTPKTFFNVEDLSITLGEALATRAKLQIVFEEPSIAQAKTYIAELLNATQYRAEPKADNPYFPFDDGALTFVLKNIGRLSIRKINEVLSLILELAMANDAELITEDFVNSIKSEIVSWEQVS